MDFTSCNLNINNISTSILNKSESMKNSDSVKECLELGRETALQKFMSELKNNVNNDLVDSMRTFGKLLKRDGNIAEILNQQTTNSDSSCPENIHDDIHKIYLKSHKSYYPSEQINRKYEYPFNRYSQFGKPSKGSREGMRMKKLLHWINPDPVSRVSRLQADYYERSQARVGETKNAKFVKLLMNYNTFGRQNNPELFGVSEILKESLPFNSQFKNLLKPLEHINKLRLFLKKKQVLFSEIITRLTECDKNKSNLLDVNELFDELRKFRIFPDKILFLELLKILNFYENNKVNYKEAINLLNWKYDFPEIPKIKEYSETEMKDYQYLTIYMTTIGNILLLKSYQGITPKKDTSDIIKSVITPNIFEQYGLYDENIMRIYSKATIFSIIEKIKDFPKDKFNDIWLKNHNNNRISIEKLKILLNELFKEI